MGNTRDLACPKCQGTKFVKPAETDPQTQVTCSACGHVFNKKAAALDQLDGEISKDIAKARREAFRKRP